LTVQVVQRYAAPVTLPDVLMVAALLVVAAALVWSRAPAATPAAARPATPLQAPAELPPTLSALVERVASLEVELGQLRRAQQAFMDDAEAVLVSVERKRKTTAAALSKIEKREGEEQPQPELPELAAADPNQARAMIMRAVRARRGG